MYYWCDESSREGLLDHLSFQRHEQGATKLARWTNEMNYLYSRFKGTEDRGNAQCKFGGATQAEQFDIDEPRAKV